MVDICSPALINITLVSISSTLQRALPNSTLKHISVKLDASNGLMMTLGLFLVAGMAVFSCGNFTPIKIQAEMVK